MVFFVCEGCNETLKKNQVEKHAMRCKLCEAVTCVDCSVVFYGNDYATHTVCISEAEKYEKSLHKGKVKTKVNPQDTWNAQLELAAGEILSAPTSIQPYLQKIYQLTNVPRNPKKFINFCKNSIRLFNEPMLHTIWEYLDKFKPKKEQMETLQVLSPPNATNGANPNPVEANPVEIEPIDLKDEEKLEERKKKKKDKKRKLIEESTPEECKLKKDKKTKKDDVHIVESHTVEVLNEESIKKIKKTKKNKKEKKEKDSAVYSMPYQVPLQGLVGGKRTLVLLDNMKKVHLFSRFFSNLESRGHNLSYFSEDSGDVKLKNFGENNYDNIIIFAINIEKFNGISFEDIIEFSNEGGNIIIALNRESSDSTRELAETFGVSLDRKGFEVIDHFEVCDDMDTSLQRVHFYAKSFTKSSKIIGSYANNPSPILYHGIGHTLDESNFLTTKVLFGNPTTYSAISNKAIGDAPESSSTNTVLVSAIQARNNARILISGSLDLFTDPYFTVMISSTNVSGNELYCQEISKWVFGETGVLRFRDIVHHTADGNPPDVILHEKVRPDLPLSLYPDPEITRNSLVYRIKDEIVYSMIVEQFDNGSWSPFCSNDMQMEFVMLDPHVRKTMICDPNTGKFVVAFTAPDNYGVFKFRVLYRRTGYSVLHAETQVSIRPFKHNEYERFIISAYPYYASALSATMAVFVFSLLFLYSSDGKL